MSHNTPVHKTANIICNIKKLNLLDIQQNLDRIQTYAVGQGTGHLFAFTVTLTHVIRFSRTSRTEIFWKIPEQMFFFVQVQQQKLPPHLEYVSTLPCESSITVSL